MYAIQLLYIFYYTNCFIGRSLCEGEGGHNDRTSLKAHLGLFIAYFGDSRIVSSERICR